MRGSLLEPKLFIFDEATSALDASNEIIVMVRLNEFADGITAVVIDHRLSTVKNAYNIIVLENGEIVEQGTHKNLIKNQGPYFQLVKNQLELGN